MKAVIGAGPAGSYFASLAGDCELFEEHREIGKPVACTGIMTKAIFDLVKLDDDVVLNTLRRVRVFGLREELVIPLRQREIVVDRAKLDQFLVRKAEDGGVRLRMGHRFLGMKNGKLVFRVGDLVQRYDADIVVGADGPGSLVGMGVGLLRGRKYWVGKQYRVKMRNDAEEFSVFFGEIPDFFGWVVPEDEEYARVGIASEKFSAGYFEMLVKRLGLRKEDFVECQSGIIPRYDGRRASKGNVYLLGDAAGHVKATTGGGIVYGMRGARCLANALRKGDDYERAWRKEFGRELWFHLQIRKFLNTLDAEDYDGLLKRLQRVAIGEYNRDYPFRKMGILMQPGLLWWGLSHVVKHTCILRSSSHNL